jgi:hypothetical protein
MNETKTNENEIVELQPDETKAVVGGASAIRYGIEAAKDAHTLAGAASAGAAAAPAAQNPRLEMEHAKVMHGPHGLK